MFFGCSLREQSMNLVSRKLLTIFLGDFSASHTKVFQPSFAQLCARPWAIFRVIVIGNQDYDPFNIIIRYCRVRPGLWHGKKNEYTTAVGLPMLHSRQMCSHYAFSVSFTDHENSFGSWHL